MLDNFNLNSFISFAQKAEVDVSNLVGQFKTLENSVTDVSDGFVEINNSFAVVQAGASRVSVGIGSIAQGYNDVQNAASSTIGGLSVLSQSFSDLQGAQNLDSAFAALQKASGGFEELKNGFDSLHGSVGTIMDGFNNAKTGIQGMHAAIQTKLLPALQGTAGKISGLLGNLKNFGRAFLIAGKNAFTFAGSLIKSAMTAIPAFVAGLGPAIVSAWAFTAALLANPITLIIGGVIALGAALFGLIKYWDQVKEAFLNAWGWIKEKIDATPTWLLAITAPILLIVKHWDQIKTAGVAAWSFVKQAGVGLWNWIVNTFSKITDVVVSPIIGIWNWIKGLINKIISSPVAAIFASIAGIDLSEIQKLTTVEPPKAISSIPVKQEAKPAAITQASNDSSPREVIVDNRIVIDGREIAKATGRQTLENAERSGSSLSPGEKREILESGGTPAMAF